MENLKDFAKAYGLIGAATAIVSAVVLIRDGKDSASKIAYHTTLNGVMWPLAFYYGAKKSAELKANRLS